LADDWLSVPKKELTRAERNIAWAEQYIIIPEGKFWGRPLKMADFMKDDFRAIFDNPHGTRRAIITRGRKNAKTVETAILMLLFLCGPEAQPNSQLFSAAQSRDQASVLFALAAKMVRLNPDLHANIVIRDTAKQLFCPDLGTLYRALSAEAATAFGLSPRFVAHDELGQVRGPRSPLYEALETATAAQADPLSVIISTQAPTDSDLLSVLVDDAKNGRDPRTVLRMQTAPEDLDPFSEDAIRAANPAFDLFMNKEEVLAMAEDAKAMPSRQAEYENLVLNRRIEANNPFISRTIWQANGGDVSKDWGREPVWSGLDLSSTSDLTAHVPMCFIDGAWEVKPTFWLPEEGLREKSRSDRVPYDVWAKDGFLNTTPGKAVEYEWVAKQLYEFDRTHNWQKCAFDRWGMKYLKPWLLKAGFTEERIEELFEDFGQGTKSMSPALRDMEAALLGERVRHGNHPVLTMCVANAVVTTDPAGGRKLNKAKSAGRIDGAVSMAMAFGVAPSEVEPAPAFELMVF
jgi:phage terminase large subunit-like protein